MQWFVGLCPGGSKPKTYRLVFASSSISTFNVGWFSMRIIFQSGVTCLTAECFSGLRYLNQTKCIGLSIKQTSLSHQNAICSRHDIAEKLPTCVKVTINQYGTYSFSFVGHCLFLWLMNTLIVIFKPIFLEVE